MSLDAHAMPKSGLMSLECRQGMKLDKFGFFKSYKAENREKQDTKLVEPSGPCG